MVFQCLGPATQSGKIEEGADAGGCFTSNAVLTRCNGNGAGDGRDAETPGKEQGARAVKLLCDDDEAAACGDLPGTVDGVIGGETGGVFDHDVIRHAKSL